MMRTRLSIFLFLISSICFAQAPEVVLTTGHTDQVNYLDVSPDGKILASGGNDKLVKLWDIKSGKELMTLSENDGRIEFVKFSDDNKLIGGLNYSNQLKIWDVATGKLLCFYDEVNSNDGFDFTKDGKVMYLDNNSNISIREIKENSQKVEIEMPFATKVKLDNSGSKIFVYTVKGELKTLSYPDGKELNSLSFFKGEEVVQAHSKMMCSKDGKYLALSLFNQQVYVVDLVKNTLHAILKGHSSIIPDLKFFEHINDQLISIDAVGNVINWDLIKKKEIARYKNTMFSPVCVEVHPSQAYFLINDMKVIDYCNVADGKIIKKFQPLAHRLINMSYDQKGKWWATAGDDITIKLWDLHENKIAKVLPGFFPLQFSPDGNKLVAMSNTLGLAVWNPETGEKMTELSTESELIQNLSFSADGKYLAGAGFMGVIKVWDMATGKLIKKLTGHEGGIYGTAFSVDGKYIASCGLDQTVRIWDFSTEKEIKKLEGQTIIVSDVKFSPDGKYLASSAWDKTINIYNVKDWTLKSTLTGHVNIVLSIDFSADGKLLASAGGNNVVSPSDNTIRVWDVESGKEICAMKNKTGMLNKIVFDKKDDFIYSCGEDGFAKIWNYKNCTELVSFMAAHGNQHLIITPDHYYTCSKGALDAVAFKVGADIYPFEQFDLKLNRPDIVAKRIGHAPQNLIQAYEYVYKKRIKRMNFTEEQISGEFHIPLMQIVSNNIPVSTQEEKLNIKLEASDLKYNIDRVMVWLNNVPVFGSNGMDVKAKLQKNLELDMQVPLVEGKNKITFSCINEKGAESLVTNVEVLKHNDKTLKPDLYIVAIGVSEYADKNYNLKYAAKDAEDIIKSFSTSKELFNNIFTKAVLNADATKNNIRSIKDFISKAKIDDEVIVFIAGHGMLDDNYDYYYGTHDIDFINPAEKGMVYEEIEELFNTTNANKKLLFMDTCHSGELDKDEIQATESVAVASNEIKFRAVGPGVQQANAFGVENTLSLMDNLFGNIKRGSGATIISSAGGAEYAMESDAWKNGLFTYCLLNGLSNKKADADGDGNVLLSELQNYVSKEVETLSAGKQKPTARAENLENDYRVR